MGVPWPEKVEVLAGGKRKRAIRELVQGRDSATHLHQLLLRQPQHVPRQHDQLVLNILKSFSDTLSVIASSSDFDDGSAPPELSPVGSACSGDRRSLDSGDRADKRPDKRGCYTRRRNVETWTTITPTMEDGQIWRKYGQKDILNAKNPRAYFRCTHKLDQGCRATKQVQLMEDDSQLYETTYIGVHTCTRDKATPPQLAAKPEPEPIQDPYKIRLAPDHQEHNIFGQPSTHKGGVKGKAKEEWDNEDDICNVMTVDSISWLNVLSFDSSSDVSMVYSCADADSEGLDLDFKVDFVGFDNFDENEFL